jgi:glycosyltransferase involved in cell wall biosynthesis
MTLSHVEGQTENWGEMMHTLITFATQWGSKYGGINSFNTDFLTAFGVAYYHSAQVICIVASATAEEIEDARKAYVHLVPLPYPPDDKEFAEAHARAGIDELKRLNITYDPDKTIWLGHDRFTGTAANAAGKAAGGRSALIHHMSYDHYESYAEQSSVAYEKKQKQSSLFQQADLVLAIGPLLRDALSDLLRDTKPVHMLIPGLAEIVPRSAPKTFSAFMSGRLSDDAARIKQGHLGIAAFAQAHREARESGMPDGLCNQPKLVMRGIDFEAQQVPSRFQSDPETELKHFAEEYAQGVINLQALSYTHDREILYSDLSSASTALMPSWHEGFGLVAWEAIAAGVPLIISKNSGVYRLLEENHPGAGPGCVWPINVCGSVTSPFFRYEDLQAVVAALKVIANNPGEARRKAGELRGLIGSKYTWPACVEQAANAFEWHLQKGSIPAAETEQVTAAFCSTVTSVDQASPLRMPQKQWKAGCGIADSQLLRAEEAVVPFNLARKPEIDTLNAWLDDPQWPIAVRLVTGAGGLGKTRLALELCEQRIASGWRAGFLDTDLGVKDMVVCGQTLRSFSRHLLIVIDYAETRQSALLALIKALVQNSGSLPVRLLLLARAGGEWWDNLPSKNPICEPLLSGYATSGPFSLPSLHTEEADRHNAYRQALLAFSQALDAPAPEVVPELTGEHFDRPLYLQMAALLALHGERPTTAEGLTKALLNHERRYWRGLLTHFAWAEPECHAQQLLALATLAGGFAAPKEAQPYWAKLNGNALSVAEFNALFHALAPLYPGKQGLQAVRPDLLGEALVAQDLLCPEAADLLDAVLSNNASQSIRRHALTVIARLSGQRLDLHETLIEAMVRHFAHCCHEIAEVSMETTGCLPYLAEAAFARLSPAIKSQVCGLLESVISEESVQLAELSCLVTGFLVGKCHEKLTKKNCVDSVAAYARALGNHSITLARTGRNEEALCSSFEAVRLVEQLNAKVPQRFESDYAMQLGNYSVDLSNAGQGEEALKHSQQSMTIFQRLSQKKPDLYEKNYAQSLSNYATDLRDAGQEEEALKHSQQSVAIFHQLAQKNPRYEPNHAASLEVFAACLGDVGQKEEALKHSQDALAIHQRLAKQNPDRHEPDYAMSLNNYARCLSEAGQEEEALEHAQKALAIRQRLTLKNPDRYKPNYATSLNNYASHLSNVGRDEEALNHARQSLDIHRQLAQLNPDRYEPDYAMSLNNYANRLSDAGRNEEALNHARQALDICQRMAEKKPDRYEPDYAMSLNIYAASLSDVGQNEEALNHARHALDICQQMAEKKPDRHTPNYAITLNNYADCLCNAGLNDEALHNVLKSLEIRQRLAQKNPKRFVEDLFYTSHYASLLSWLCNYSSKNCEQQDLSAIPATVPSHRVALLVFYSAFVGGCCTSVDTTRKENFRLVISKWGDLSLTNRKQAQSYWLCAAAWCVTFAPEMVADVDWQEIWRKFTTQRQGRIPEWMKEVARRMGFQWPA